VLRRGGHLALHQYADYTWSPRALFRRAPASVATADVLAGAPDTALAHVRTYTWRSIRVPPYLLRLPERFSGTLWSHRVLVFVRQ